MSPRPRREGGESAAVRIALLGSGLVSELYMLGLDEVRGHDVVVNYSRSAERAREFGQRWRIPHQSSELGAAIGRDDVDLVVIGLPNVQHVQATRLACQARKHVVCTKPLGRSAADLTGGAILGTNLGEVSLNATDWPFVDAFRTALAWIPQRQGAPWGQGGPPRLTPQGWVASLDPGQAANAITCRAWGGSRSTGAGARWSTRTRTSRPRRNTRPCSTSRGGAAPSCRW